MKYSRIGLKVKCLKCQFQLNSNGTGLCRRSWKSLSTCEYQSQHRYNFIICLPNSKARRTRVAESTTFETVLLELSKFKEELRVNKYQRAMTHTEKPTTSLIGLMAQFIDCMGGVNTPKHRIRVRSASHVKDCKRTFLRFCKSLKQKKFNTKILDVRDVNDNHVGLFCEFLLDELRLGDKVYKKHLVIMKTFYKFCIENRKIKMDNPFYGIELKIEDMGEKNIIRKEEFLKLIGPDVVTYENGWKKMCGKNRNMYRNWLVSGIRLALETGVRTEEIFEMRYSDIVDLGNGVLVFGISNLKVNRIISGSDVGKFRKHLPITASLMQLLMELGYPEKKGTDGYIIERAGNESMKQMMSSISRGFNHFITIVTDRDLKFKCLRKSYYTYMALVLGDKVKLFSGGSTDVLRNHYLASSYIAAGLNNFKMF